MEARVKFRDTTHRPASEKLQAFGGRLTGLLDLQGFWAITDQAVVSLGNFLTTIILARSFLPEAYGVWTVLFGLILFLNSIHASLISYPLTVMVATHDRDRDGHPISDALVLTVMLNLPLGLVVLGAGALIGRFTLGLWVWLALLCWQLQETTRRALMARFTCRKALLGDAISYLGQAGFVWTLSYTGGLSLARAFGIVAATCGLAALTQALQLREHIGWPSRWNQLTERFWKMGHWVLWSELASSFGFQATPWVLFLLRGAGAAAGYQAISNLLGLSHPVMLSLGNVIVPAAARARARNGLEAARRVALVHTTQGGVLLLLAFGILIAFPKQLLALFYGSGSAYLTLDQDIRLFAVVYFLFFISLAMKFLLNALQQTRRQFVAELVCGCWLGVIIVPLVLRFGLAGAIGALGLWFAARIICGAVILRKVSA